MFQSADPLWQEPAGSSVKKSSRCRSSIPCIWSVQRSWERWRM